MAALEPVKRVARWAGSFSDRSGSAQRQHSIRLTHHRDSTAIIYRLIKVAAGFCVCITVVTAQGRGCLSASRCMKKKGTLNSRTKGNYCKELKNDPTFRGRIFFEKQKHFQPFENYSKITNAENYIRRTNTRYLHWHEPLVRETFSAKFLSDFSEEKTVQIFAHPLRIQWEKRDETKNRHTSKSINQSTGQATHQLIDQSNNQSMASDVGFQPTIHVSTVNVRYNETAKKNQTTHRFKPCEDYKLIISQYGFRIWWKNLLAEDSDDKKKTDTTLSVAVNGLTRTSKQKNPSGLQNDFIGD